MTLTNLTDMAETMLRKDADLLADARKGAPVGNSLLGALLTRPLGPSGARQYSEQSVRQAIARIDRRTA
jgi:hypothetical protein